MSMFNADGCRGLPKDDIFTDIPKEGKDIKMETTKDTSTSEEAKADTLEQLAKDIQAYYDDLRICEPMELKSWSQKDMDDYIEYYNKKMTQRSNLLQRQKALVKEFKETVPEWDDKLNDNYIKPKTDKIMKEEGAVGFFKTVGVMTALLPLATVSKVHQGVRNLFFKPAVLTEKIAYPKNPLGLLKHVHLLDIESNVRVTKQTGYQGDTKIEVTLNISKVPFTKLTIAGYDPHIYFVNYESVHILNKEDYIGPNGHTRTADEKLKKRLEKIDFESNLHARFY